MYIGAIWRNQNLNFVRFSCKKSYRSSVIFFLNLKAKPPIMPLRVVGVGVYEFLLGTYTYALRSKFLIAPLVASV